jgi:four helix bundle protein
MPTPIFDHEKLKAYQRALHFVAWVDPVLERLPGKISAKDHLDRASTSVVLNLAEGNGKRSGPDRCRFFDIARGSAVECAACLDVLWVKKRVADGEIAEGKAILLEVVAMTAGLIARFSTGTHEEPAEYQVQTKIEENDKE